MEKPVPNLLIPEAFFRRDFGSVHVGEHSLDVFVILEFVE